jgi:hypothetical protein
MALVFSLGGYISFAGCSVNAQLVHIKQRSRLCLERKLGKHARWLLLSRCWVHQAGRAGGTLVNGWFRCSAATKCWFY